MRSWRKGCKRENTQSRKSARVDGGSSEKQVGFLSLGKRAMKLCEIWTERKSAEIVDQGEKAVEERTGKDPE